MRIFLIGSLTALLALSMGGQQAPQPAAPGSGVTFSSNTNLVVVDITVKDKSGKAIEGLKKEDFTVLEDGKPQKVAVFEYQHLSMELQPPPAITLSDQVALPTTPVTTITAEARGQIQYHNKRLLVFFFDFSSMGIPEQLRAQ